MGFFFAKLFSLPLTGKKKGLGVYDHKKKPARFPGPADLILFLLKWKIFQDWLQYWNFYCCLFF